MRLLNLKKTAARIKARTAEIKVGETYFLSSFYDKSGAMVRVEEKSTLLNKAGWPSSVTVTVLEEVGENAGAFYRAGNTITCNATNLYEKRENASTSAKYGRPVQGPPPQQEKR
jgi:hypothetical protein